MMIIIIIYNLFFRLDSRVKDMWLMGSIVPITVIVVFYLGFVLKIGPEFMRYRKPYDIDRVVMVYNVVQILFSIYAVKEVRKIILNKYGPLQNLSIARHQ